MICVEIDLNKSKLIKEIELIFKEFEFEFIFFKLKNFNLFTVKNFFNWKKIYLTNKINNTIIQDTLKKNNIELSKFEEIFYSNERISNYLNNLSEGKKIFFFHGIGDIKIFVKQNKILESKNFILHFLNKKFNKIEIPKRNSLTATLLKNNIKPEFIGNNMISIDKQIYKKKFKQFSKQKLLEIGFEAKNSFLFYILKFPRFKVSERKVLRKSYLKKYLNFQFNEIKKFIDSEKKLNKHDIVIKTKNNISKKESQIINQLAKKIFSKEKIKLLTSSNKNYVNAEIIGTHEKCKMVISNMSTADFVIKIINPKTKIIQYSELIKKFYKKENLLTKKNVEIKEPFILNNYYKSNHNINL